MRNREYVEVVCVGRMERVSVLPASDRAVLDDALLELRERRWYEGRLSEDQYLAVAARDERIVNSVEPV